MDQSPPQYMGGLNSGSMVRFFRLWSGVILFIFLLIHSVNAALGLFSLSVIEETRGLIAAVLRNRPVGMLLYGSLITHQILAITALFRRRHFRLSRLELLHISSSLFIIPLLVSHFVNIHVAREWYGVKLGYDNLAYYFSLTVAAGLKQAALLSIAWLHGCLGLHYWLSSKPWYSKWGRLFLVLAVLIPILALLGLTQAVKEAARLAADLSWLDLIGKKSGILTAHQQGTLTLVANRILFSYYAVLTVFTVSWLVRHYLAHRKFKIRVYFPGNKTVVIPNGYTVLDAARTAGIPHSAICGGRGRCTTCRISVQGDLSKLPEPNKTESKILEHLEASSNVRLACQLRPNHDISVTPLVKPSKATEQADEQTCLTGREQDVAIMFADLRGFTTIAERKLPYDVVFLLNRYFDTVGSAVEYAGGTINQFTGDGVMALFGLDSSPSEACRHALAAACRIAQGMTELSGEMAGELKEPLRIGMGIHFGRAVVGHMGRGIAMYLTAVGDTVHLASRFQELTKDFDCQLVISEQVAVLAGVDLFYFPRREVTVRNRQDPVGIRIVKDIDQLDRCLGAF